MTQTTVPVRARLGRAQLGELDLQYGDAPAIGLVLALWEGECLGLELINGRQEQGYCVPSVDRQLVRVYSDPACDESSPGAFAIYSTDAVIGVRYLNTNPTR